jgi:hypothetical protein
VVTEGTAFFVGAIVVLAAAVLHVFTRMPYDWIPYVSFILFAVGNLLTKVLVVYHTWPWRQLVEAEPAPPPQQDN